MPTKTLEREWAHRGAIVRLQEIDRERSAIFSMFPDLRRGKPSVVADAAGAPRRRRTMSAAAKRSMSAGMRKYWAKRKAAEAKAKGK
jgi:hypothetical protein